MQDLTPEIISRSAIMPTFRFRPALFLLVCIGILAGPVALTLHGQQAAAPAAQPQQPAVTATPSCPELATALTLLVRNDARMRDWAALARYREANRSLPRPKTGEERVVFMGDSITDFWQQSRFGGFFPGKPYVDRGISGQTTPQMLVRFRPDVVNLEPKAVVILAGTNDIAGNTGLTTDEDIENNLASMSELASANGIRVVLASITPVSEYHQRPQGAAPQTATRPMSRIRAINTWMKQYTASKGYVYLDYFSAMVDEKGLLKEELSEDDLHPNVKGYAVMAPLAEASIAQALKR
jgi:lysophospholipase L1-like esterase